jgi:hypothetical protein
MHLRPLFNRRVNVVRIVTTLGITLIPAMRGCNTARAAREHTEQRRDYVLHEILSGASWLAVSG